MQTNSHTLTELIECAILLAKREKRAFLVYLLEMAYPRVRWRAMLCLALGIQRIVRESAV